MVASKNILARPFGWKLEVSALFILKIPGQEAPSGERFLASPGQEAPKSGQEAPFSD